MRGIEADSWTQATRPLTTPWRFKSPDACAEGAAEDQNWLELM